VNRWTQKDQMLLKEADLEMRRIKYVASYIRMAAEPFVTGCEEKST
jgi:hypothetical protein